MKTAAQVTDAEMAVYRATARQRAEQARQEQAQRAQLAWALAQRAAVLLKQQFGAQEVILFGSLARRDFFHPRSDIDLAVKGIAPRDFWRAWAALDTLSSEFAVDLVDVQDATPALKQEIERGIAL